MYESKKELFFMRTRTTSFLLKHNFPLNLDITAATDAILDDMRNGLCKRKAGQDMISTWMLPPSAQPKNESVIVIDAGGTNFRSCLVTFGSEGEASISDFRKTRMPGVERELSKVEFFNQIADNIDYLKNKSDKIGFCFSYSMQITKDGDGIPNGFSKEVKAPEVIGCPVGKTLAEVLESHGWNKMKRITLVNDTVSALLAGKAFATDGIEYSSYIGFILGTGMNAAYIQPKDDSLCGTDVSVENQIIVCESGKCDKIPLSDFDKSVDEKTNIPGQYLLEKGCSGAYLGKVCYEVILQAAKEGLFSSECASKINSLGTLELIEANAFLCSPFKSGKVADLCATEDDRTTMYELFDAVVERDARLAVSILAANAIQSGGGKSPVHPISILCNGTTFFKTHKLKERVEGFLEEYLTRRNGIYFEIVAAENDITIGTAVAGLI